MPSQYYEKLGTQLTEEVPKPSDFFERSLGTLRLSPSWLGGSDKKWLTEHVAKVPTVGLGRAAIIGEIRSVDRVLKGGSPEARDDLLDDAFNIMGELSDEQREIFNGFIKSKHPSEWLEASIVGHDVEHGEEPVDYIQALTSKNEDGTYKLDRATRMNFLEWHNAELAHLNAEFQERKPGYLQMFKERYKKLVDKGVIPHSALQHLERLDITEFSIDDGLTTQLDGNQGHHIATYEHIGHVVLSPDAADVDETPGTFIHELMHAMQGTTVSVANKHSAPQWRRDGTSGLARVFGWKTGEDGGLMLNEAVTEELALLAVWDEELALDPNHLQWGEYTDERYLLAILCNSGLVPIEFSDFVAAYMEDNTQKAQNRLFTKLREAFPFVTEDDKDIVEMLKIINRYEAVAALKGQNGDKEPDDIRKFCSELLEKNHQYTLRRI